MKYRFEPVPGKPNCFRVIDKQTNEPFNVAESIADQYAKGSISKK